MGDIIKDKKVCLDVKTKHKPLVQLVRQDVDMADHDDGQCFKFRVFNDLNKEYMVLIIKKDWLPEIPGFKAMTMFDSNDDDEISVLPTLHGCNNTFLLVLIGVLAANSGDPSFLPRLTSEYTEFQATHRFKPPRSILTPEYEEFQAAHRFLPSTIPTMEYMGFPATDSFNVPRPIPTHNNWTSLVRTRTSIRLSST